MAHKLTVLPPSSLKEAGEIREAKTKSILKISVKISTKLKVLLYKTATKTTLING